MGNEIRPPDVAITPGTIVQVKDDIRNIYRSCGYSFSSARRIEFRNRDRQLVRISNYPINTGGDIIDIDIRDRFPIRGVNGIKSDDSIYPIQRLALYLPIGQEPTCYLYTGISSNNIFSLTKTVSLSEATGQMFHEALKDISEKDRASEEPQTDVENVRKVRDLAREKIRLAEKEGAVWRGEGVIQAEYRKIDGNFVIFTSSNTKAEGYIGVGITLPDTRTTLLDENGQDNEEKLVQPQLLYLIPPSDAADQRVRYRLHLRPIKDGKIRNAPNSGSLNGEHFEFANPDELDKLKTYLFRLGSHHLWRL